jgi:hypothetical protein
MKLFRQTKNGTRRRVTAFRAVMLAVAVALPAVAYHYHDVDAHEMNYSSIKPRVIDLGLPGSWGEPGGTTEAGGLIAVDLNRDGQRDFLVTKRNHVAAYDGRGPRLWVKRTDIQITGQAEAEGLPGAHAPGVQAADIDGDGRTEVLFLDRGGALNVLDGATGETRKRVVLAPPAGSERWEHLVVANFRGRGDRDLLLQATNAKGYRMGRFLAAYALEHILADGEFAPLWTRDDFVATAHNGARVADVDGDGRDEVLGATIVGPDGRITVSIPVQGHLDGIHAYNVRPDLPGLEVVALEEGNDRGNLEGRVFLYRKDREIWVTDFRRQEPQNTAVGRFDPDRPGLQVWCRSRYDKHQKPFVFDAAGNLIAHYQMDDVAPEGWTSSGVEVIFTIDWTGERKQLAVAKERHAAGDVAIFDPIAGRFLHRFREKADRLYVADVLGDWREEIIVVNGDQLRIYENDAPNPDPGHARLWDRQSYARSKMTWNYYSP